MGRRPTPDRPSNAGAVLDDHQCASLFTAPDPETAPDGYREVARVLAAAQAPGTADELAGERLARQQFHTALTLLPPRAPAPRRSRLAVGAAVVAGVLAATTGLAAAQALPGPLQDVASHALGAIGIDVPDSGGPGAPPAADDGSPAGNGGAPAVSSDADLPSDAPGTAPTSTAVSGPSPATSTAGGGSTGDGGGTSEPASTDTTGTTGTSPAAPPTTTAKTDNGVGNGGVPGNGGANPHGNNGNGKGP